MAKLENVSKKIKNTDYSPLEIQILRSKGITTKGWWFSKNNKMIKKDEIDNTINTSGILVVIDKLDLINKKINKTRKNLFKAMDANEESMDYAIRIFNLNKPESSPKPVPNKQKRKKKKSDNLGNFLLFAGIELSVLIRGAIGWATTGIQKIFDTLKSGFSKVIAILYDGLSSFMNFIGQKDAAKEFSDKAKALRLPPAPSIPKTKKNEVGAPSTGGSEVSPQKEVTPELQSTNAQLATNKPNDIISSSPSPSIQSTTGGSGTGGSVSPAPPTTGGGGPPATGDKIQTNTGKKPNNVTLGPKADISKVEPELLSRFYAAAVEYGKPLKIETGYRGDEYQAELWVRANIFHEPRIFSPASPKNDTTIIYKGKTFTVKGGGKGSAHALGQAIDVSPTAPQGQQSPLDPFLKKHGLWRPFINGVGRTKADAPHIQYAGKMGADIQEGQRFMNNKSSTTSAPKTNPPTSTNSKNNINNNGYSLEQHFGVNEPTYTSHNQGT